MDKTIESIRSSFEYSYDAYKESRERGEYVTKLFHNEQYTPTQAAILRSRGAPAETFNVIKLFTRVLIGYYSTVVNTVKASPTHPRDTTVAALANDIIAHAFRTSQFETEGDNCKQDLLLSGLCCVKQTVEYSGEDDEFGRSIYKIKLSHVPSAQIVPDPMSVRADYGDARWQHRWKWITEETLKSLIKDTDLTLDDFDTEHNHLGIPEADYNIGSEGGNGFNGAYYEFGSYLLVDTVSLDDEGKRWQTLWIGENIISQKEITFKEVKFPYRLQRLYQTTDARYYGLFEEVVESQHAINQALVKLQQFVNTQKVFYEKGSVADVNKFKNQVNRINAIIEVKKLKGIKVENLSAEARDQYQVIDASLNRIKMLLGVTDSFLGMAFASDSGRKVKLQQNATAMAMRHITVRIEQFYRLTGWDVINLAKQYYYAHYILNVTDNLTGQRWVEVNKPLRLAQSIGEDGVPVEDFVYEEVLDPESGEPLEDDNGYLIMAPVTEGETALEFTDLEISLDSVSYNDEDEKAQLLMEQVLSGPMGQTLNQIKPQAYMKVISLIMKTTKTRYSPQLADIFEEVSNELNQVSPGVTVPGEEQEGANFNQSRKSQALKLPQNTNEGAQ